MPFDGQTTSERAAVEADIRRLVNKHDIQAQLAEFSPWKIRAGNTTAYQLVRVTPGQTHAKEGYFLANLVMQGGGTLGLAHAGFIRGLELAGFRFPALAGTSAGAILAVGAFAARGDNILSPVAPALEDIIDAAPMHSFVDGPRSIRRVLKTAIAGRSINHPLFLLGVVAAVRRLLNKRGLNHGHVFEDWTAETLKTYGIETTQDLEDRMERIAADLAQANGSKQPYRKMKEDQLLRLISVAMPTGTKFVLPKDLALLDAEYQTLSAARMVRMSMSIPLFFDPVTMRTNDHEWRKHVEKHFQPFVADHTALEMAELQELTFLDGGLFSNLPTDTVTVDSPDEIGCISVPLVSEEATVSFKRRNTLGALVSDAAAVFNAVRHHRDREIHQSLSAGRSGAGPNKVLKIDTGKAHWLNFNMSREERDVLFLSGLMRVRTALSKGEI